MDDAKRGVALVVLADDHAEPIDIREPGEADLLLFHLAPDRVRLLRPSEDLRIDAGPFQLAFKIARDLLYHVARFPLKRNEPPDDRIARLGVQDAEGQILQLLAHPLHPHASGQRRIDVHRLARLLKLLVGPHGADGAHVVQPVGQLDEDDPQVLRHRHEQLAEVLGLLRLGGRQLKVGQLGDAIDQSGDLGAELTLDLGKGRSRVLDGVVQKGGDDGGVVELLLGQDRRHRDGMGEITLARMAHLAFVHLVAIGIRPADQVGVGLRVIVLDQSDQVVGVDHPAPTPRG